MDIVVFLCIDLLIDSPVDGHVGIFPVWGDCDYRYNKESCTGFCVHIILSFSRVSGMVGSCHKFNFVRNGQALLQSDWTILYVCVHNVCDCM